VNLQPKFLLRGTNLWFSLILVSAVMIFIFMILPTGVMNNKTTGIQRVYYADNISTAIRILINRFNRSQQGKIEIIPVDLPFTKFSTNERKELLARTLRSKSDRIDIFTVDIIWVPRFAKWCQPLDQYFPLEFRSEVIDHAMQSCSFDGQLVAIPLYTDIGLMYYRRDLIAKLLDAAEIEKRLKASVTWQDFISLHQRFEQLHLSNPFYIFPANNYEGLICSFYENLTSQDQSLFVSDSIRLNTPQAHQSLQLLVDLVNQYHMTPPIVTQFDEFQSYLYALDQDAIFIRSWPGLLLHYRSIVPDSNKLNLLERAALPHFGNGKPAFVYGGWNLMISKYSTKTAAAVQFIQFVLRQESQQLLFEIGDYLPVNRAVYEDSIFLAKHPELDYYRQLLRNGVHRPYLVDYTKTSDVLSYYIHLAIKKEISVSDALKQAEQLINSKQGLIK